MNVINKLNLGSGTSVLPGYINIDRKHGGEVYPLKCKDESIDEIRASHILEHFSHKETLAVLKNWTAKLKVGGGIRIAVPDFKKIIEPYGRGEKTDVLSYTMGGQTDNNDYHKAIFDRESLFELMTSAGLTDITEWASEIEDCASLPISLNLQGTKTEPTPEPAKQKSKIAAVMSMPRLCFSDNVFAAMRAMIPLGMTLERGVGVFWGQILTRMIEKHLDDAEFIITLDYDTWFTHNHIRKLAQLMAEHPEADAIVPVQIKRNDKFPLVGVGGDRKDGQTEKRIAIEVFQKPLTPVETGHFGLTIFRVSALKKLKKPWFWSNPGPDGRWEDGRVDEDIYFWNNFAESGFKAFMANEVFIGHLQMVCTFPGRPDENWKPIHVYMNDLETKGPPEHCEPKIK